MERRKRIAISLRMPEEMLDVLTRLATGNFMTRNKLIEMFLIKTLASRDGELLSEESSKTIESLKKNYYYR